MDRVENIRIRMFLFLFTKISLSIKRKKGNFQRRNTQVLIPEKHTFSSVVHIVNPFFRHFFVIIFFGEDSKYQIQYDTPPIIFGLSSKVLVCPQLVDESSKNESSRIKMRAPRTRTKKNESPNYDSSKRRALCLSLWPHKFPPLQSNTKHQTIEIQKNTIMKIQSARYLVVSLTLFTNAVESRLTPRTRKGQEADLPHGQRTVRSSSFNVSYYKSFFILSQLTFRT